MKQERSSDNRLDGNVMQVGGHQTVEVGMIDNMTFVTMPADQQYTTVPMDASGNVQGVPGPSTQMTHDQIAQSQAGITHLVQEEEDEEDEEEVR